MRTFVCKSNEGNGSRDGCLNEAKRTVSFFIAIPSPLTSLTSSVNRLNGSKDGDVANQPIKILEKYQSNAKVHKQNKLLLAVTINR